MERYGIQFPNVQETKCFYPPCEAGRMRNSSPPKSLKIEIEEKNVDGILFTPLLWGIKGA
jgi:hypothetical protein